MPAENASHKDGPSLNLFWPFKNQNSTVHYQKLHTNTNTHTQKHLHNDTHRLNFTHQKFSLYFPIFAELNCKSPLLSTQTKTKNEKKNIEIFCVFKLEMN